jgi:Lon protease-like protein
VPELPLFPLRTVLFPDGLLELKIFEARYLDLMSRCLRERVPFGVVALRSGSEAQRPGEAVRLHDVGTLAALIEADRAQAGTRLGRGRGGERFALGATRQERDGLWLAATEPVGADEVVAPGASHAGVVRGLAEALDAIGAQGARPFLEPHRFDTAGWVANRWCEILPLPLEVRQRLWTLADPLARLDVVDSLLRSKQATH